MQADIIAHSEIITMQLKGVPNIKDTYHSQGIGEKK